MRSRTRRMTIDCKFQAARMEVAIRSLLSLPFADILLLFTRSDLRPFLLPPQYESHPFKKIDELVVKMEMYDEKMEGGN